MDNMGEPDFEAHLASCPSCGEQWSSLSRALTILSEARDAAPPATFRDVVMARVATESRAAASGRARTANFAMLSSVLVLAGACIVGLAAVYSLLVDVVGSPESLLVSVLIAAATCANALMTVLAVARAVLVAARNVPPEVAAAACVFLSAVVGGSIALWASRPGAGSVRPKARP
jgi:hypothetical protein